MPPKAGSKPIAKDRPVIFPKVVLTLWSTKPGATHQPLTADKAKEFLGWEEVDKGDKKDDYMFVDEYGKRIRCNNNAGNRPFYEGWARCITQDILNGNYRLNLENAIIGNTGLVLSAQHRFVGLVLARQIWERAKQKAENPGSTETKDWEHWKKFWPTEPTIDTAIAFGGDESEQCVQTLDNTRPRGFSDVMYTAGVFKKSTPSKREAMCKVAAHAVRRIWERTGSKKNPYAPNLTNSELMDFVRSHAHIPRAAAHCFEEDGFKTNGDTSANPKAISTYIPLGTASAMMYLMGCINSDNEEYRKQDPKTEAVLNWDMWERAGEFWSLLASRAGQFKYVIEAMKATEDPEKGAGTMAEKLAVITLAWGEFARDGKIRPEMITLAPERYKKDEHGNWNFVDQPSLGGLDSEVVIESDEPGKDDPSQAELAQQAEELRKDKLAKLRKGQGGGGVLDKEGNSILTPPEPAQNVIDKKKPPVVTKTAPLVKEEKDPDEKPTPSPKKKVPARPPLKGGV